MLDLSAHKKVRIVEVGPRDGLQNEKKTIPMEEKVEFIKKLASAGLRTIEVTSFVRAEKIPQMGDSHELYPIVAQSDWANGLSMPCLVPNLKGLENAQKAGVKEVAVFSATSETFNQNNINASIDESLERIEGLSTKAQELGMSQRAYVSTVFGCPYEGPTSFEKLLKVCEKLFELGAYEVSLGDTIGVADPLQVQRVLTRLKTHFDLNHFSMHFHDTHGRALANILASVDFGVTSFDASAAGLGGCPYAPGATGNVATEDVVALFERMGIETGVELDKLVHASDQILKRLERAAPSRARTAYLASKK